MAIAVCTCPVLEPVLYLERGYATDRYHVVLDEHKLLAWQKILGRLHERCMALAVLSTTYLDVRNPS